MVTDFVIGSIYSVPELVKFTTGGHHGGHPDLVRFGVTSFEVPSVLGPPRAGERGGHGGGP